MKKSLVRMFAAKFLVLSVCLIVSGQHNLKQENSEVRVLEIDQVVEREISPMQKHRYQIKLEAYRFIKIEVAEKVCDVITSFRSPDNTNLLEFHQPEAINGVRTYQAAVAESGDYELRIVCYSEFEGTGSYTVKIAEVRPATEAELNFTAGMKLFNEIFNPMIPALSTIESLRKSIEKGKVALEKFRLAKAIRNEAFTLRQIGVVYFKLGEISNSIEYLKAAIEKYQKTSDKKGEVYSLVALADNYINLGDAEKAVQILSQTLEISRELELDMTERDSLNRLGDIYADFGDLERAEIYYKQSAELVLQYKNVSYSYPLTNLGKIAFYKGETEKASEYFQKALETVRSEEHRLGTTKAVEATFLNNIGRTQYKLKKTDKAVETFNESLAVSREVANKDAEGATLRFLGRIYSELGDAERSLEFFKQSLEIYRGIEDTQNIAETLLFSARAEMKKGDMDAAQNKTEQALNLIETIRMRVQTVELRDSFSANLNNYYEFYVELLMRRHAQEPGKNYAALAFEANERRKARGLLNLLAESNANIREGMDADLLRKEADLRNLLSSRFANLTKILGKRSKPEDIEILKREIEEIRSEFEQIQIQIRNMSPRYAALTEPKTLSVTEIQNEILDADSVLLEYYLGEAKSFLWVISKDKFQTIELPAKGEIEKKARNFYEALTARNKQVKFETAAERDDRIFITDSDLQKYSKDLSEKIIAPAKPFIQNKKLLIVADGALQYVPFAAFKIQNNNEGQRTNDKRQFLIETNEIVNLPSASVLAVLRKETANRKIPAKTLAVLADPIFDKTDERFQTISKRKKSSLEYLAVSKKETRSIDFSLTRDGLDLPRLPFTRREADLISAKIPENKLEKLLDFTANKTAAMSSDLAAFKYVHFATHGFINNKNPELSGIVFSMLDENGKEQDGFLRVGDVYNLKIPAELVVLSGCRTGLGKEIKGEGLVGLTRGFIYAGARRVAVSLWDVNDEATSILMEKLYKEMLGDKKLSPASALRQAQIEMIKDKKRGNPYYWAAFILQGEPR